MMFLFLFFILSLTHQQLEESSNQKGQFHISEDCNYQTTFINQISNINKLCFIHCNFYYSSSSYTYRGGAIYITITSNTNLIENCTFKQCRAIEGGCIYILRSNPFTIEINSSLFENNIGKRGGSIYCLNSTISFTECIFNNNTSNGLEESYYFLSQGSSIYSKYSNLSLSKCSFIKNIANANYATYSHYFEVKSQGGCIYLLKGDILFSQCYFINNVAKVNCTSCSAYSYGGALYLFDCYTTLINCYFNNNMAIGFNNDHTLYSYGGAIHITNYNATILNCTFNDNIVKNKSLLGASFTYGSAFRFDGEFILSKNCSFINNTSDGGTSSGTVVIRASYLQSFFNCSFNNNIVNSYSYSCGGGINFDIVKSSILLIENCNFNNNFVNSTSYNYTNTAEGGGININILNNESNILLINCNICNNCLKTESENYCISYGGGLYMNNKGNYDLHFTMNNCTIKNNIQTCNSKKSYYLCKGTIYIYKYTYSSSSHYEINVNSCFFINNSCVLSSSSTEKSFLNGSIIYSTKAILTIDSCVFVNNSISENSFNSNFTIYGGIICSDKTNINLTTCIFQYNHIFISKSSSSTCCYGGIFLAESNRNYDPVPVILIENCLFNNNNLIGNFDAFEGYLIFSAEKLIIKSCEFINNQQNCRNSISFEIFDNNYWNIDNCTFNINALENSIPKSLISMNIMKKTNAINNFTNNKIIIFNSANYYIFNGTSDLNLFCYFEYNCINPYDSNIFITNKLLLCNKIVNKTYKFEEAFTNKCIVQSNEFTKSNLFSHSQLFSQSSPFTKSSQFIFIDSNYEFIKSTSFSSSVESTKINSFESYEFTKRDSFSSNNDIINYKKKGTSKNLIVLIIISVEFFVAIIFIIIIIVFIKKAFFQVEKYNSINNFNKK